MLSRVPVCLLVVCRVAVGGAQSLKAVAVNAHTLQITAQFTVSYRDLEAFHSELDADGCVTTGPEGRVTQPTAMVSVGWRGGVARAAAEGFF